MPIEYIFSTGLKDLSSHHAVFLSYLHLSLFIHKKEVGSGADIYALIPIFCTIYTRD